MSVKRSWPGPSHRHSRQFNMSGGCMTLLTFVVIVTAGVLAYEREWLLVLLLALLAMSNLFALTLTSILWKGLTNR